MIAAPIYRCSVHPDVVSDRPEQCGKLIATDYLCDECGARFSTEDHGKVHPKDNGRIMPVEVRCQEIMQTSETS